MGFQAPSSKSGAAHTALSPVWNRQPSPISRAGLIAGVRVSSKRAAAAKVLSFAFRHPDRSLNIIVHLPPDTKWVGEAYPLARKVSAAPLLQVHSMFREPTGEFPHTVLTTAKTVENPVQHHVELLISILILQP
jgi:hypothetical protein